jgi:hypothetical protein
MTFETWLAFLVAGVLISASPGAGAVACMAAGSRHGYRLGIWNILGMQVGIALQLAVVGAGLGAILAASTAAFTALKFRREVPAAPARAAADPVRQSSVRRALHRRGRAARDLQARRVEPVAIWSDLV